MSPLSSSNKSLIPLRLPSRPFTCCGVMTLESPTSISRRFTTPTASLRLAGPEDAVADADAALVAAEFGIAAADAGMIAAAVGVAIAAASVAKALSTVAVDASGGATWRIGMPSVLAGAGSGVAAASGTGLSSEAGAGCGVCIVWAAGLAFVRHGGKRAVAATNAGAARAPAAGAGVATVFGGICSVCDGNIAAVAAPVASVMGVVLAAAVVCVPDDE